MFSRISRWWQQRIIRRSTIPQQQWQRVIARLPVLARLDNTEVTRLIELSILFMHAKTFEGAKGLKLDDEMKMLIALQACLPILNLGIDWYDGWVSIIVYPAQFIPERNSVDEYGIEHRSSSVLSGESWHRGPVILSWEDTAHAGIIDGHNLVIHEFAHKLDVLNGTANGFPPLHRDMKVEHWVTAMSDAFADLQYRLAIGHSVHIDGYAATSPAEFFAVVSEVFFERPDLLQNEYPEVYQQFKLFYRQDPFLKK